MSENIRGITFAEQSVTPADDAIVRRAILGDGILTGCKISYSGATLTMAAGYIIACGRAFQITTAQNWAVVDATSGVARLVLTIDLTKTATENAFNQIDFAVEYASTEDGFADLVQEDINIAGTKYQIVAAVVSLGTGGITGIVSKLAQAEGGGGLNFKVVDGLTQPGSATENTIWVKTEGMTGWIIDANQPEELTEGMVWISTGTESDVKFNALKKNGIQVYPLSAQQCIDGALVDVTAMSYQGGEWVEWISDIYLYNTGDECSDISGGWVGKGAKWSSSSGTSAQEPPITFNDTNLYAKYSSYNYCGIIYAQNPINLTGYSELKATGTFKSGAKTDNDNSVNLCVWSEIGTYATSNLVASANVLQGETVSELSVDVSSLTGKYYIGLILNSGDDGTSTYIEMETCKLLT